MTILRELLNLGINAHDAEVLEQYYADEPDFISGLETIARIVATNHNDTFLEPSGEPWRTIFRQIAGSANPAQQYEQSLAEFPPDEQIAISGAISHRVADISQEAANTKQRKKRKSSEYIKILKQLGYEFRYNICTNNIEVNGKPINDMMAAEIRSKLRDAQVDQVHIAEDAYIAVAWNNRYNPMRDYLQDLKYEGEDVISELASHFQDEHGVFPILLKRWLVGAVARVMQRCQNRMLVLDGAQGLGKDYFARWLASPMVEYFHEGAIIPEDKDCRLRLMSTWIWNVSELGATTRKSDREALKAFLSLEMVRDRKPFGKFDIQGQAISSFIGTINNEGGFLSDPTGNRRFMTCRLVAIDWSYTRLDVNQVWAQAYDLYIHDERWDLSPDEISRVNEINSGYQIDDIVEQAILKYFKIDPTDFTMWMSTIEIAEILDANGIKLGSQTQAAMAIGRAATSIGLRKMKRTDKKGNRLNGYCGISL